MSEYTLFQGDCLEFMKSMPDKSVDAVITDPPYGIGIDGSDESLKNGVQIRKAYEWRGWDAGIPSREVFDNIRRTSKINVVFGANYFNEFLEQGHKGWIVWEKGRRDLTMSDCEIIYTNTDKPTRVRTVHRSKLWAENPKHPTQKPLTLLLWIIENYTEIGQTIFDPFMGSGTTGVAALQLGRKFIGCELSPEYFAIAEKRIKQAQAQPSLFTSNLAEPSQGVEQLSF